MKIVWLEAYDGEIDYFQSMERTCRVEFYRRPLHEINVVPGENTVLSVRTHSDPSGLDLSGFAGVVSRSTGYDHLLHDDWPRPRGYLPGYASTAVAEHNLLVTLALMRRFPRELDAMEQFRRDGLSGLELSSQRVGILGTGSIGKATAERFKSLAESVFGFDLQPDYEWARRTGIDYLSWDDLLDRSSVLVACLPLNEQSRGMLNRTVWSTLGPNAYFVNCGRGEVAPPRDLESGLENGDLRGIALDVFSAEGSLGKHLRSGRKPAEVTDPAESATLRLLERPDVIATPHNAFNTEPATRRKVDRTLEIVRSIIRTGDVPANHRIP